MLLGVGCSFKPGGRLWKAVLGLELVVKWVSGWRWMGKGRERYLAVSLKSLG